MDRNIELSPWGGWGARVALRKESVDRNIKNLPEAFRPSVALRKESVDRNTDAISDYLRANRSLSARRAWIEIPRTLCGFHVAKVALRKESVDRNRRYCCTGG